MNPHINTTTQFIDLGLIDYQQAWDYQTDLFNKNLEIKKQNRDLPSNEQRITNNHLIFCEHPHVYTLGKSGDEKNLLIKKEDLHTIQASYYAINRGGDITYHGPGQLVVYPVIDLENFFTDIHQYMRLLEEAVIQTLQEFQISAGRIKGLTGVWIDFENGAPRKICALGVKTSRWVTMHGLAFNVNTDLNYFNHIVPCGIDDKAVTSLQKEMGARLPMEQVKSILKEKIISLFDMKI
ncbi:MAG: lipoyl(octanoyl) transferase LipB [Cytophagales bacterium]|nr:lipoyl(octanoyl) transferase LipB [Cytophagales bacterium]MCA6368527.1 lipoyl(octanoyl) transferase LipB [Cytophagales bacterium]MCA6370473.1 lipoyl(octanoyl) transferase LipB [Cytophagales bacterium]MCA6377318.1 lipoyl(octanoyl) transferase LipB [Cytophagales bacterium]MCA6384344.1 lipoyl(octanoyl) transferase LipB [Cytophagales bacterium]